MNIIKDLNQLLDKAIDLQKKQKRRNVIVVLILAFAGGTIFWVGYDVTETKIKDKFEKDSTTSNPMYQVIVKKQKEDIKDVIEKYFDARKAKDITSMDKFYSDTTFDFFYSYPRKGVDVKLSKKEVLKIDKIDFSKKENRSFEFVEYITISSEYNCNEGKKCPIVIFVRGKQFSKNKMYDSIIEVKLSPTDHKIYSIRSYIDYFRDE